jgi:hypothetical protein
MEKIFILIDQKGIDRSALQFACYLAELSRSSLTGLFISEKEKESEKARNKPFTGVEVMHPELKTKLSETKTAFSQVCSNKGIRWSDEGDVIYSIEQIIEQTRFADLLIVGAHTSFYPDIQVTPTGLIKEILRRSECAVIVAPGEFESVNEVIFAYDGSKSSVYAIKQFTYLFPEFSETKAVFLQVNNSDETTITEQEKIKEYLKMHYSAVGYHVLHGDASDELMKYMIGKKNIFVVMGAFGRNILLSSFKTSTSELLLKMTSLPVFITHH